MNQIPKQASNLYIKGKWTTEYISELLNHNAEPIDYPNAYNDLQKCIDHINLEKDINILVIGSISPWIECLLIKNDFKNIYMHDINPIEICDERIKFLTLEDIFNYKYDLIISYSVVEHIGLGRYGDTVDENGDINYLNNTIYNILNDNGIAIIAIPVSTTFKKEGIWHRIYDENRIKMLFEKYNILFSIKNEKYDKYIDFSHDKYYNCDWKNQPCIVIQRNKNE